MLSNTNYAETLHQASLFNPTNSFLFLLLLLLSSPPPLFFTHSPSRLFSLFNQMELQLLSFTVNPFYSSPFLVLFAIAPLLRHVSSRERKKKRKPMTPVTSKVKKVKMKFYSSYKSRFRPLNDGTIRCWHEGKNHNAHGKDTSSSIKVVKGWY
ncbi:hypothetical protein Patl1_03623 [Pistacia atlantica]|uniref:Uncharacterized protein n=1 Tax=Pistacia atlantica TaxID=434234 RepID=A0ACC1C5C6_9ROSI|nr:hypothetical protein Patl1_03623 [Pistacia atlantica]